MFRWCAYCQHFVGERAPFDDYSLTHGICADCRVGPFDDAENLERVMPIIEFHAEIRELSRGMRVLSSQQVIERGLALGLRPTDLLLGILQPVLYELGQLWDRGEITTEQEAEFTRFCTTTIAEIERSIAIAPSRESVLLFNAPNNLHVIGLHVAGAMMRHRGYDVTVLDPTPPLDELIELIRTRRPAIVGVSVAAGWQLPLLDTLVEAVAALEPRPRIVAGGLAIRLGHALPAGVEAWDLATG